MNVRVKHEAGCYPLSLSLSFSHSLALTLSLSHSLSLSLSLSLKDVHTRRKNLEKQAGSPFSREVSVIVVLTPTPPTWSPEHQNPLHVNTLMDRIVAKFFFFFL